MGEEFSLLLKLIFAKLVQFGGNSYRRNSAAYNLVFLARSWTSDSHFGCFHCDTSQKSFSKSFSAC